MLGRSPVSLCIVDLFHLLGRSSLALLGRVFALRVKSYILNTIESLGRILFPLLGRAKARG